MKDQDFESAFRSFLDEWEAWENGGFAQHCQEYPDTPKDQPCRSFCDWHCSPPDPDYYRPLWKEEEATCFQVYETVSEGTPVTPPFATEEELIDYLVAHGDFWDQKRGDGGWNRESAERFVERGHAFSMMVTRTTEGVEIKEPRDGA